MIDGSTAAAIFALLGVIYVAWRDRNSAGDALVEQALAIAERLDKEVEALKARNEARDLEYEELKRELNNYKYGVGVLIGQLRRMGVEPEWTPSKKDGAS